jgi:hypothetical protein
MYNNILGKIVLLLQKSRLENAQISQLAVILVEIQTVTNYKTIGNLKAAVIGFKFN